MKSRTFLTGIIGIMLFGTAAPGFSQDFENQNGDAQNENIITAVSIAGLKRTKHQIIEKYLLQFIGASADDVDINDVYASGCRTYRPGGKRHFTPVLIIQLFQDLE